MDVRVYYRKIREVEAGLSEGFVVVVSKETPDGGKAGVMTEVPRYDAAKLVVENRARLATEEEAMAFRGKPNGTPGAEERGKARKD